MPDAALAHGSFTCFIQVMGHSFDSVEFRRERTTLLVVDRLQLSWGIQKRMLVVAMLVTCVLGVCQVLDLFRSREYRQHILLNGKD